MKKFLKVLAVLALLGVIALVAVGFFIGPIVTKTVNTVGPRITGTRVELDSAKISLLTGGGTLAGLFVGNPAGWSNEKALYLGTVRASVQPTSVLSDCIVVNEVFVDGPEFVFEQRLLGGNNIDALIRQIEANMGGPAPTTPTTPPTTEPAEGEPLKFMVKSFRLQNARMSLIAGGQTLTVPLPPLTITDLGVAQGGITADQVAAAVLKQVSSQMIVAAAEALKHVGGALIEGGSEGAKGAAKGVMDKLFGK